MPIDIESLSLFQLFESYTEAWSTIDQITLSLITQEYNKRFRLVTGASFNDAYNQYLERYWVEN